MGEAARDGEGVFVGVLVGVGVPVGDTEVVDDAEAEGGPSEEDAE